MITQWSERFGDGAYRIERNGEELDGSFGTFDEALTYAKSIAAKGAEIGATFSEHKYVRGPHGGWKRQRVEWIERPPCKADCQNAGMEGACLWCGGGYRKVDPASFMSAVDNPKSWVSP
jgi:hypothetical protein